MANPIAGLRSLFGVFGPRQWDRDRNPNQLSTLIRHARLGQTFPVGPLTVPMIQFPFGALLMPAVGFTALLAARFLAAVVAAIAMPSVAATA